MANEAMLRGIEELAKQLLSEYTSQIRANVYQRSPRAWSVVVEYVGSNGLPGVLRATKCQGKEPTKAIEKMHTMLNRWAEARKQTP